MNRRNFFLIKPDAGIIQVRKVLLSMKEKFIEWNPNATTQALVELCDSIIANYQRQGFDISIRQLFYQLVSKNYVPNSERSYKNLINAISQARLAGLIDWEAIVDRGRETHWRIGWIGPKRFLNGIERAYTRDKWTTQANHVEVMVEKQALEGVLIPICSRWQVPFSVNKGYSSQSALYTSAKRLEGVEKPVTLLYLGDHDPSGMDMTRDIKERLELMSRRFIEVIRVALNLDQVRQMNLPPNPTKAADTRADGYIAEFGEECWELDAIEPAALARMVDEKIKTLVNQARWRQALDQEAEDRETIKGAYENL